MVLETPGGGGWAGLTGRGPGAGGAGELGESAFPLLLWLPGALLGS